jgi:hypothetical protein
MNATVNHRAGCDHRHGDGVEELTLGEPVEAVHHAAVEERNDRQPAAEDEGARLGEVPREPEQFALTGPVQPGEDPRERRRDRRQGRP